MKNLSLQMTETAALKKPTMAVNKSNVSPENSASAEANRSFKMMLNKQVQDTHLQNKQVQEKQLQNKHIQNKQIQDKQIQDKQNQAQQNQAKIPTTKESSAKPDNAETVETANKNSQKESHLQHVINAKNHTKAITEAENPESSKLVSKELTDSIKSTLDAKLSLAVKGDDANPEEAATHAADTNLTATASILAILPPALLENKQAISSTAITNTGLALTANGATQKQQTLGAQISNVALNNALSQGKNNNIADTDAHDLKETVEGKLLRAIKPMDADESANSKLALNAAKEGASKDIAIKDITIKDIAVKDMITPASSQPAVQIKAAEAVQQAGSSNVINAYPGKTGWDQAISQKVVWMLGASEQSATLTLNPPELGPLQVVIRVHNDKADTTFISDNAEVRQALQDGMENLRGKLNESGIQLGQANVSSGGQMQQQFQQASQKNGMGSQLNNNNASASQLENTNSSRTIVRVANGLVDTFA
ncbi:MAG: flagellar hook-length control protein FliK [Methylotenera sp.]|uniref:flagellar hook-length control protein FliK n=1 Tax=Methylotenera sp. TaxID=2051956 RepID=UPI0027184880|nr:flagellar hook-length control protein FliK [Methylotenera sp.]MDO9392353.1 flagellar hook-length control protein FliK [Methylotenera sp.]MDP1522537.1 flagellar hook-length control protein FliK [Methylotenera sp.]